jgi:hypothetical protein
MTFAKSGHENASRLPNLLTKWRKITGTPIPKRLNPESLNN